MALLPSSATAEADDVRAGLVADSSRMGDPERESRARVSARLCACRLCACRLRARRDEVLDKRAHVEVRMSEAYNLQGAYPNPFRSRATIEFAVREAQDVTVELYDTFGERVRVWLARARAPRGGGAWQ